VVTGDSSTLALQGEINSYLADARAASVGVGMEDGAGVVAGCPECVLLLAGGATAGYLIHRTGVDDWLVNVTGLNGIFAHGPTPDTGYLDPNATRWSICKPANGCPNGAGAYIKLAWKQSAGALMPKIWLGGYLPDEQWCLNHRADCFPPITGISQTTLSQQTAAFIEAWNEFTRLTSETFAAQITAAPSGYNGQCVWNQPAGLEVPCYAVFIPATTVRQNVRVTKAAPYDGVSDYNGQETSSDGHNPDLTKARPILASDAATRQWVNCELSLAWCDANGGNPVVTVKMPNCIGQTVTACETLIAEVANWHGTFQVLTTTSHLSAFADNAVVRTAPRPGEQLDIGQRVDITKNLPTPRIALPDCHAMSYPACVQYLRSLGLLGTITQRNGSTHDTTLTAGQVQTTQPAPGVEILPSDPVVVVVDPGDQTSGGTTTDPGTEPDGTPIELPQLDNTLTTVEYGDALRRAGFPVVVRMPTPEPAGDPYPCTTPDDCYYDPTGSNPCAVEDVGVGQVTPATFWDTAEIRGRADPTSATDSYDARNMGWADLNGHVLSWTWYTTVNGIPAYTGLYGDSPHRAFLKTGTTINLWANGGPNTTASDCEPDVPNPVAGGGTGTCDPGSIPPIDLTPLTGISFGDKFPFGFLAWIRDGLTSWESDVEAPSFHVPLLGHWVDDGVPVSLAPLDPVVPYIRAGIMIMATFGLFYFLATGFLGLGGGSADS
jgi:hypothetical protein